METTAPYIDERKIIRNYVEMLHMVVQKTKKCFTKGTFVIADPSERLYRLLRRNTRWMAIPATTHRKVNRSEKERLLLQHEVELNPPVEVTCTEPDGTTSSAEKGNIKFYQFRSKSSGVTQVFFKLEGYGTYEPKHWFRAWTRYGPVAHPQGQFSRREDETVQGFHNIYSDPVLMEVKLKDQTEGCTIC
jgi:hypothetical protein